MAGGLLKNLYKPVSNLRKGANGQVTIIGGSSLFHGAPILALKTASRIVDMVFFSSPEKSVGEVAEKLKSQLASFIWVPFNELDKYIEKSDAVLIGPGFMRYEKEGGSGVDSSGRISREITEKFLKKYPKKKWVIDAGSLQVIEPVWIPDDSIITPNEKEYKMLFGNLSVGEAAKKYNCIIISKGEKGLVCSAEKCMQVKNGNPGFTKGGTGDVMAGLAVALLAKNEPFLAACATALFGKSAADELKKKFGDFYNADDLADQIPKTLHKLTK
jgi:NAD(P)H-hydrate epimerase